MVPPCFLNFNNLVFEVLFRLQLGYFLYDLVKIKQCLGSDLSDLDGLRKAGYLADGGLFHQERNSGTPYGP